MTPRPHASHTLVGRAMFAAAWLTLSCVIPVANGMVATTLPKLKAAVICPGFLNDAADFEPLAKALCARGIATAVAPFPLWHWIPQIGGRSVRPVLERIDHAVRHVAAMDDETLAKAVSSGTPLKVPPPDYGIGDVYTDFMTNPGGVAAVGGSASPDEYPIVEPRGRFQLPTSDPRGRVAVIGHSASGWMARIFLSERAYGGKAYAGASLVHSLVTLGTPHHVGQGVPFVSVEWANRDPPVPQGVRCLAVGSKGILGSSSSFSAGAYAFCVSAEADGAKLDGDGVTTIDSAIGIADGKYVERQILEGVTHYCWTSAPFADQLVPELTKAFREGQPWYGSDSVLDADGSWVSWLNEACKDS